MTLALLALAPSARAAATHPLLTSFGSFSNPQSVATDDSGHVYVLDVGAGSISKFDTAGAPANFSALASNTISGFSFDQPSAAEVAVDNSGGPADGDIYVVSFAGIDIYGADGTHLGGLDGSGASPVTGGEPCGVATDAAGNVYAGYYSGHVDRYVPAANPVTNADFDSQITGLGSICVIAADSTGAAYVSTYSNGPLQKYPATQFGGAGTATEVSADSRAVGIDPTNDDVYVARESDIARFDSSGTPLGSFGSADVDDPRGVAVDVAGDVFVGNAATGTVSIFGPLVVVADVTTGRVSAVTSTTATLNGTVDPDGVALTDCRFEYTDDTDFQAHGYTNATHADCDPAAASIPNGPGAVAVSTAVTGLASGLRYHFRIVAANANGTTTGIDQIFDIGPRVHDAAAAQITSTDARLSAQINPEGKPTTYHFDYGTTTAYGQATPESGSVGSDTSEYGASRIISGLTPGTTYHFRVVATNADAVTSGLDTTFSTFTAPYTVAACPNDALRTGAGAQLPDCRAYEQASPVDKDGADIVGDAGTMSVSVDGDAVTSLSLAGVPGSVGTQEFPISLARRDAGVWSTHGLQPPASAGGGGRVSGWTPDLDTVFDIGGSFEDGYTFLERASSDGSLTTITPHGAGLPVGVSADGSKVYFQHSYGGPLTPDAPAGTDNRLANLYVWDRLTGTVSLAGVLPDAACGSLPCAPAGGSFAGAFRWFGGTTPYTLAIGGGEDTPSYTQDEHVVSTTGDKVFFTAGDTGQIYLRKNAAGPDPTTVHVSAPRAHNLDPNGAKPAIFMMATPSGDKAFFTSCEKLTDDSTAVSTAEDRCDGPDEGADLYVYNPESDQLIDLTVDVGDPHGADVKGVLGISQDGSYAYFAANGDLDHSRPVTPGDCHMDGLGNRLGECNLYVAHDGTTTFIGRIDNKLDGSNWQPDTVSNQIPTARVSTDGHTLVFSSVRRLTSYDNTSASCSGRCLEFYRYRVGGDGLTCVTCDPTGAPGHNSTLQDSSLGATSVLPPAGFLPRNLSANGDRFFFESDAKLVAGDTNAQQDVYEWEADGSGTCLTAGGCFYLLSTGTSSSPSYFAGASESGDDAFIFTRDPLVPQDEDALADIYDASVGGGLEPQHATPTQGCIGDACQGAPSGPPAFSAAASMTFAGAANASPGLRPSAASRPKVSGTRTVVGARATLVVRVPGPGRLTGSGSGLRTASKMASRAGGYKLTLTLTNSAKKRLKRKRALRVRVKIVFRSAPGASSTATTIVTFKAAAAKKGR